jgi:1-deoxyxylulose-5-phosphate synthase
MMEYRKLGHSGLKVSAIGLGTNAFGKRADSETSIRIIHEAISAGVNFIDTANIYSDTESERIIGEALAGKRHEVVLATKVGLIRNPNDPNSRGSSRYHIRQEIEGSLKRLKTDYIDLYQIHTFDPQTPLEETLRTLDDLVHEGKVRYIGASNYAAWELMKAIGISDKLGLARYISVQPCYSLADRTPEQELVPVCLDQGVGVIPYFPLAGGILTGKYSSTRQLPVGSRADKDPNFAKRLDAKYVALGDKVSALAKTHGNTPAALSLAWLLHQPVVSTIIVGATNVEQVRSNLEAISIQVDAQTMNELNQISDSFRYGQPFGFYRLP